MNWQKTHSFWLGATVILQIILVCIGFNRIITDGQHHAFKDSYDGMRNYFAYNDYIFQETTKDPLLFEKMNYPFGDYIFYTDNSPILAVSVKWFSKNIYDLSDYNLLIFNYFFLFSIVLSSFFLYLIGKNLLQTKWLISIFSLAIPWISPQLFRLGDGHFGLSLTVAFVMVIYGLLKLHQNYHSTSKKIIKPIIGLIFTVVFFSFFHIYLLAISGFLIGYFCLIWAITNRKKRTDFWKITALAGGIPLICLGIVFLIIRSVDKYYLLRQTHTEGFNISNWHLKTDALHDGHYYLTIPSFLKTNLRIHYDAVAYIGSFALYGFVFFLIFFLIKKLNRKAFQSYFLNNESGRFVFYLFLSGLCCLFIAFGPKAHFFGDQLIFDNWLNPLYWLENILPQVTQFRCMARFNWVFFLSLNLLIVYILDQYYQRNPKHWSAIILIIIFPLMLVLDTKDTIKWTQPHIVEQPLNNSSRNEELNRLLSKIDINQYQSILPLPYYHATCEDYNFTIDPEDIWCTTTFQLSHLSGLPLMSSKMGRTPLNQTYSLFDMLLKYEVNELIASELNEKPILVIYNSNENAWSVVPSREPARTALFNGKTFPKKLELQELNRLNDWILYKWDWKKNKK